MWFNSYFIRVVFVLAVLLVTSSHSTFARSSVSTTSFEDSYSASSIIPAYCRTKHDVGRIVLAVNNNGTVGQGGFGLGEGPLVDCFGGPAVYLECEYPKKSQLEHLWGLALWVGGVLRGDTLVSTGLDPSRWDGGVMGKEMFPGPSPDGGMVHRSTLATEPNYDESAVSEQDIFAKYNDSLLRISTDYFFSRPHRPLFIEIIQKSYAWSYSYADDFVLFDLTLTNIGKDMLNDVYVGIMVQGAVALNGNLGVNSWDDICGYLKEAPSPAGCGFEDTVNIAWMADDDGDPYKGQFIDNIVSEGASLFKSAPHVTGVKFLGVPEGSLPLAYNWWIGHPSIPQRDFGPRRRDNFHDFRTGGLGAPHGDINKYYVMSSGEVDYDQAYTAVIRDDDPIWRYPDQALAREYAAGRGGTFLLSFGPITLPAGASTQFAFAYVAGENLHTDVNNLDNLPNDPEAYYANLDFSDLAKNAMWAGWIYDNPGIDTDGDGYFGKSRVCVFDSALTEGGWVVTVADTSWYEGDGVPDWRAAGPPPAPDFWMEPAVNGMTIRFNGSRSETAKDIMTGVVDFEGYHIWLGRDDRESSYSVIAGYDLEDFDKFVWNERAQPNPNFELFESPFTIEQLRCLYGSGPDPCNDSTFDPYRFTRSNPYIHPLYPDSIFMFKPHNFNMPQLDAPNGIHKVYPNEPPPPRGVHPDSLSPEQYTDDGYLKYYEYEFTIENLLPTVPYWVNVTAFDFGSPESGVFPLETSRTVGAKSAFPFMADNRLNGKSMKVYVYPNPYRIDGNYRANGYEGRTQEIMPNEKVRAVHFANLPAKCTISIFSIDGDLVRKIHHDVDPSDPNYLHDEWNLVTRNRQAVVSGLYYWTVEDDNGNVQIGKLAIVM